VVRAHGLAVIVDDTVTERISTRAPGSLIHHTHHAKLNGPPFLRGQGWLCLAAVVEHGAGKWAPCR
jgi:hypothetical protein